MVRKKSKNSFWVVIPIYNEEKLIEQTLDALKAQSDTDITILCVNNASTDLSPQLVRNYIELNPQLRIKMIHETQKGTGAASDTGFRYAISKGANVVARTDADALPCVDWVSLLREDFRNGARIVGGRLEPRTDESNHRWYDQIIGKWLIRMMEHSPRIFYRRPGQKYPMFMIPGLNMAIDAQLYVEVGGFPRSSIDDTDEDLELHLKVCQVIPGEQARLNKKAIVYGSVRKARSMGYIGILLWYWGRKYTPKVIDVR
jgi:glycosyltransferase involved in cell wall biosynthesis